MRALGLVQLERPRQRASIFTYTADPGSKSEETLNLLGSWAATLDQPAPAHATDEV